MVLPNFYIRPENGYCGKTIWKNLPKQPKGLSYIEGLSFSTIILNNILNNIFFELTETGQNDPINISGNRLL